MTVEHIVEIVEKAWPLLPVVGAVFLFWLGDKFVSHSACAKHRENFAASCAEAEDRSDVAFDDHEGRIASMYTAFFELKGDQKAMRENLRTVADRMERIEVQIAQIHTFLFADARSSNGGRQ